MKSQISDDSFRADKRYSGVYQQQGRPLRDADQNESTDILKQRQDQAGEKAIRSGAPREGGAGIEGVDGRGLPLIRAGTLFAGGIPTQVVGPGMASPGIASSPSEEVFAFDQQIDYPASADPAFQPPTVPGSPSAGYVLFADIWDRVVIFLEDLDLIDPALHGVDTCTRAQTMAQIKWCATDDFKTASGDEPLVLAPPAKGNATLTVEVRSAAAEEDPCDPCATVVQSEAESGNYLFRLEVHRVTRDGPAGRAQEVVFKWSSENGAEHHQASAAPDSFKVYDGVFEFFSAETEKHSGVYWSGVEEPAAGQLVTEFPTSLPAELPFVRRWDGCCVLVRDSGGTWRLGATSPETVPNIDRDQALAETAGTNHGDVGFDGGVIRLHLEYLTLLLELEGRDVVRGDYWLARVRTALHAAGDLILDAAEPIGILHHYLWLAEIDAAGEIADLTDPQRRRLNFPPLTDVRAVEVGFTDNCNKLFNGAENVQAALDELCNIEAADIAYSAGCRNLSSVKTVQEALDLLGRLAAIHYIGGDGQSVTDADPVAAQLCEVRVVNHCGPIEKAKVRFVAQGNGRVAATRSGLSGASSNQIDIETGADGVASCAWRLDPEGETSQQMMATLISTDPPRILSAETDHIRFNAQFVENGRAVDPGTHIDCIVFPNDDPLLIEVLENDWYASAKELLGGIQIFFDRAISSPIVDRPTVQLVLEVPDSDFPTVIFHSTIVDSLLELDPSTKQLLFWTATNKDGAFETYLGILLGNLNVLARLIIKGNFIWSEENGQRLYVDGETFGATRLSGGIEAVLPSGDGLKGGTFESWFWLTSNRPVLTDYTLNLSAGLHAIANHLSQGTNKLSEVLPNVPDGTRLYKWDATSGSYSASSAFELGAWSIDYTLGPGEGAIILLLSATSLTFRGTQITPQARNLASGKSYLISRQIPGPGIYENIVGAEPAEDTRMSRLRPGEVQEVFDTYTFKDGHWTPYCPKIELGESAFIKIPEGAPGGNLQVAIEPAEPTVVAGETLLLNAVVTGGTPVAFAWFKNGTVVAGADKQVLEVSNVSPTDNGATFTVRVKDASGQEATSPPVTLKITSSRGPGFGVVAVRPVSADTVEVVFDRPLDESVATDPAKFSIRNATVGSVKMGSTPNVVRLSVRFAGPRRSFTVTTRDLVSADGKKPEPRRRSGVGKF